MFSLLGSALGAGLAAWAAVFVLRRQISYDKSKEEETEAKNFLKSFEVFSTTISVLVRDLIKYRKKLGLAEDETGIRLVSIIDTDDLRHFADSAKSALDELNLIKDEYIPQEVYKKFLNLKRYLEMVRLEMELMSRGENLSQAKGKGPLYYLDYFDRDFKEIRDYAKNLEKRLNNDQSHTR